MSKVHCPKSVRVQSPYESKQKSEVSAASEERGYTVSEVCTAASGERERKVKGMYEKSGCHILPVLAYLSLSLINKDIEYPSTRIILREQHPENSIEARSSHEAKRGHS